jgi:hypothetical protein
MHQDDIFTANSELKLAQRLDIGRRLYVTDRAAQLDHTYLWF